MYYRFWQFIIRSMYIGWMVHTYMEVIEETYFDEEKVWNNPNLFSMNREQLYTFIVWLRWPLTVKQKELRLIQKHVFYISIIDHVFIVLCKIHMQNISFYFLFSLWVYASIAEKRMFVTSRITWTCYLHHYTWNVFAPNM